ANLEGVEFVVANTDAQAIANSLAERRIQLGLQVTAGLGAGARPDVGRAAAEEAYDEIVEHLRSSHMAFIAAGMGGG
ncbi:cell division protein FtsZ, partial [Acinetobacter baumannii]